MGWPRAALHFACHSNLLSNHNTEYTMAATARPPTVAVRLQDVKWKYIVINYRQQTWASYARKAAILGKNSVVLDQKSG